MRRPSPSDHFGAVADSYAKFRPTYPGALFQWIADNAPSHALAWDVGCGSGQATLALAQHFDHVIATDSSAAQVAKAPARDNIDWRAVPAESSGLESHSVDTILVAQALHWFDIPHFWDEARRVGKPGALLVVATYGVHAVAHPVINKILHDHHFELLGPYWPKERALVDEGYRSVEFPFQRIPTPAFDMHADWTLDQLLGYCSSWSASKRFVEELKMDPLAPLRSAFTSLWGPGTRRISWPLTVLARKLS